MAPAQVGLALISLLAGAACASAEQLRGYISDEPCGWNNAHNTKEAKECAEKCLRAGWPPVFVPDGSMKSYKFLPKDKAAALAFGGDHVAFEGKLENGSVIVSGPLRKTPPPAKKK
jgi:hypothetical protein